MTGPLEIKAILKNKVDDCLLNGGGAIDRTEMKSMLQAVGMEAADERVDHVFNTIDVNKEGRIQIANFVHWAFSVDGASDALAQFEETKMITVSAADWSGAVLWGPEGIATTTTAATLLGMIGQKVRWPIGVAVKLLHEQRELDVAQTLEVVPDGSQLHVMIDDYVPGDKVIFIGESVRRSGIDLIERSEGIVREILFDCIRVVFQGIGTTRVARSQLQIHTKAETKSYVVDRQGLVRGRETMKLQRNSLEWRCLGDDGLHYVKNKDTLTALMAPWGSTVDGVDEQNGWLSLGDCQYLPTWFLVSFPGSPAAWTMPTLPVQTISCSVEKAG